MPDGLGKSGAARRAETKRVRAALLVRATSVYGAPARLTEHHGVVELRAGGHLMCAAYSMRGLALLMLSELLKGSGNAEAVGLHRDEPLKSERDGSAAQRT